MEQATKRAVIYTRVSRDDTGEGKSNERQEHACRQLADLRGWEVVAVHQDISISAYSGKKRPGWELVLEAIAGGTVDLVVAWHLDRMTRSMTDLETLIVLCEQHGIGIATVTGDIDLTNDMGRMVARILAAVARGEVERKSARQKLANRQRATEGHGWPSGWRAFGYTLAGDVIPQEATAFKQAVEDALRGVSMKEIARQWTAAGLKSRNYSKSSEGWTARGVKQMLVNPRYAGISTYRGEVVGKGNWEPIITEGEHIELRAKLNAASRRTNHGKGGREAANLLSGIATCAKCGQTVNGGTHNKTVAYVCSRGCVGTPRQEADDLVRTTLIFSILTSLPGKLIPVRGQGGGDDLWRERDQLQQRRAELATAFGVGTISIEQLTQASTPLNERLERIERDIESSALDTFDAAKLSSLSIDQFRSMSLREQREALKRLQVEVILHPKGRGRRNVHIREQVEIWFTPLDTRELDDQDDAKPQTSSWRTNDDGTPATYVPKAPTRQLGHRLESRENRETPRGSRVAAGALDLRRGPQGPALVASGKASPHASCSGASRDSSAVDAGA